MHIVENDAMCRPPLHRKLLPSLELHLADPFRFTEAKLIIGTDGRPHVPKCVRPFRSVIGPFVIAVTSAQ
jgi:hypothetical protein